MPRIIKITEENLTHALDEAASVISRGGLVAYPTETFYGLGADALSPEAIERVFAAKGRERGKPLLVILHDKAFIERYTAHLDGTARRFIDRLMPGPVTLVLRAGASIPDSLTGGTGTIAIRVPEHDIAAGLARAVGRPLTGTSANISGMPGLTDALAVAGQIGGSIELILDGGNTPGGLATTIIDLTVSPPKLLREGAIGRDEISRILGVRLD